MIMDFGDLKTYKRQVYDKLTGRFIGYIADGLDILKYDWTDSGMWIYLKYILRRKEDKNITPPSFNVLVEECLNRGYKVDTVNHQITIDGFIFTVSSHVYLETNTICGIGEAMPGYCSRVGFHDLHVRVDYLLACLVEAVNRRKSLAKIVKKAKKDAPRNYMVWKIKDTAMRNGFAQ